MNLEQYVWHKNITLSVNVCENIVDLKSNNVTLVDGIEWSLAISLIVFILNGFSQWLGSSACTAVLHHISVAR